MDKKLPDKLSRSFDMQEFLKDTALFGELGDVVNGFDSLHEKLTDTLMQLAAN